MDLKGRILRQLCGGNNLFLIRYFNWLDYKEQITQEQFVDFVNNLEYDKLPDGIQFVLGDGK